MGNAVYPFYKAWKANGKDSAANYRLFVYASGTLVDKAVYSDSGLTSALPQPITLNSNGEATIFLGTGFYKFVLRDDSIYPGALISTFDPVNSISGSGVGSNVLSVKSITELKALSLPTSATTVLVQGYYVEGDQGGGTFSWASTSAAADDGGVTIRPASAPATGRWVRNEEGPINVKWFGWKGDGSAGDTTALTAITAYNTAKNYLTNLYTEYIPGMLVLPNAPNSQAGIMLRNATSGAVKAASLIFDTLNSMGAGGMGGYEYGGIAWSSNPGGSNVSSYPVIDSASAIPYITASSSGGLRLNCIGTMNLNIGTTAAPTGSASLGNGGIAVSTTNAAVYRNRATIGNGVNIYSSAIEKMDLAFNTVNSTFVGGITWPDTGGSNIRASGGDGSLYITGYSSGLFLRSDSGGSTHIDVGGSAINMFVSSTTALVLSSTAISLSLPTTAASTLSSTGNFAVNTNKFTVAAATGNTLVAGTLAVTGASTTNGITNTGDITTQGSSPIINLSRASADASAAQFIFKKARGSIGSETDVSNGDYTALIFGQAYSAGYYSGAEIDFAVDAAVVSGQRPASRMEFYTNASGGNQTKRFSIDRNGAAQFTGTLAVTGATTLTGGLTTSAGTTSRPSLNIPAGVAPTSPVDGDIWYDGTNIKIRVGATTKTFTIV